MSASPSTLSDRASVSVQAPSARRRSRPHEIARHYLGDLIYGANDGIITTFAVAAGVAGANLSTRVVVILGFANLIADGFSMAASNFLAIRSVNALPSSEGVVAKAHPARHALATFVAFAVAGAMPLLAYVLPGTTSDRFRSATILTLITLFVVGASRSLVTRTRWLRSGVEMLLVGAAAAGASFAIGKLLAGLSA
jgi:VIT1/CCC1 family predicted Fe2+/Mn2+ transporter